MSKNVVEAKTEDKIAKPASEVFAAIIDPQKMSNYFISRANAPMTEGKTVTWFFADVGGQVDVAVKKIEANKRIVFEWAASGANAQVEIVLEAIDPNTTNVKITESGWPMDREGVARALEQTGGWVDFLCCLKAFLLFGVNLCFVD